MYRRLVLGNTQAKTISLMWAELDGITGLTTSICSDIEVACARWHRALERMYAINGDLEF